ncbi:uncharacterized protein [Panulirus ornatus]|uniref:uncharacterized protein n=1 Tax=Panulirus ornatus TaxID=150431 RepID=UPI003A870C90
MLVLARCLLVVGVLVAASVAVPVPRASTFLSPDITEQVQPVGPQQISVEVPGGPVSVEAVGAAGPQPISLETGGPGGQQQSIEVVLPGGGVGGEAAPPSSYPGAPVQQPQPHAG